VSPAPCVKIGVGVQGGAYPRRAQIPAQQTGIEHVLVDQDTFAVTGVLDWTDAALVDPAYDFGPL
jgi:hypothetical protein